jgi:hypothetical protein
MIAHPWKPAVDTSCLADDLWKELRGLADDGLARRTSAGGAAPDNRVRGEIYLFIVDVIAHEIDRLEQEPGTERGRSPGKDRRIVDLAPSDWSSRLASAVCPSEGVEPEAGFPPREKRHGG